MASLEDGITYWNQTYYNENTNSCSSVNGSDNSWYSNIIPESYKSSPNNWNLNQFKQHNFQSNNLMQKSIQQRTIDPNNNNYNNSYNNNNNYNNQNNLNNNLNIYNNMPPPQTETKKRKRSESEKTMVYCLFFFYLPEGFRCNGLIEQNYFHQHQNDVYYNNTTKGCLCAAQRKVVEHLANKKIEPRDYRIDRKELLSRNIDISNMNEVQLLTAIQEFKKIDINLKFRTKEEIESIIGQPLKMKLNQLRKINSTNTIANDSSTITNFTTSKSFDTGTIQLLLRSVVSPVSTIILEDIMTAYNQRIHLQRTEFKDYKSIIFHMLSMPLSCPMCETSLQEVLSKYKHNSIFSKEELLKNVSPEKENLILSFFDDNDVNSELLECIHETVTRTSSIKFYIYIWNPILLKPELKHNSLSTDEMIDYTDDNAFIILNDSIDKNLFSLLEYTKKSC